METSMNAMSFKYVENAHSITSIYDVRWGLNLLYIEVEPQYRICFHRIERWKGSFKTTVYSNTSFRIGVMHYAYTHYAKHAPEHLFKHVLLEKTMFKREFTRWNLNKTWNSVVAFCEYLPKVPSKSFIDGGILRLRL